MLSSGPGAAAGRAAATGLEEASRIVSLLSLVVVIAFHAGMAYAVVAISAQTQLQEDIPEDTRGRVFGILNMLPMIPLDGGHVAIAAYEWIRTKKGQPYYRADITKLIPVAALFVAFLVVFVFAGIYLDITHPLQIPH